MVREDQTRLPVIVTVPDFNMHAHLDEASLQSALWLSGDRLSNLNSSRRRHNLEVRGEEMLYKPIPSASYSVCA